MEPKAGSGTDRIRVSRVTAMNISTRKSITFVMISKYFDVRISHWTIDANTKFPAKSRNHVAFHLGNNLNIGQSQ